MLDINAECHLISNAKSHLKCAQYVSHRNGNATTVALNRTSLNMLQNLVISRGSFVFGCTLYFRRNFGFPVMSMKVYNPASKEISIQE